MRRVPSWPSRLQTDAQLRQFVNLQHEQILRLWRGRECAVGPLPYFSVLVCINQSFGLRIILLQDLNRIQILIVLQSCH